MPGSFENPTLKNEGEEPLEGVDNIEEKTPEETSEETTEIPSEEKQEAIPLEDIEQEVPEEDQGEEREETKKIEEKLENLVGPERLGEIKEKAGENEGVSINSELLVSEFDKKEFLGKTVEEARVLAKEKLPEVSEQNKRTWEKYLQEPDEKIEELLKKNGAEFLKFEKAREESLKWFIESDIENIRLNNWHPESLLRWDRVEKGKAVNLKLTQGLKKLSTDYPKQEKTLI